MKVSYHWLKNYLDFDLTPKEVSEILTDTGLEIEGLEKIEEVQGGLKGLIIGQVKSCSKHPDADRLKVAQVDIGTSLCLQRGPVRAVSTGWYRYQSALTTTLF